MQTTDAEICTGCCDRLGYLSVQLTMQLSVFDGGVRFIIVFCIHEEKVAVHIISPIDEGELWNGI